MFYGFYDLFDKYYWILVVPALILSLYFQSKVNKEFKRFSVVNSFSGLTGAQAAATVLRYYNIDNVRIERVSGKLSDHFDPRSNVIRLSDGVYNSTSIAAIGIACHEAGHAAQHAEKYMPIKVRNAILPVVNIGSTIGIPLAIMGLFMGFELLVTIGIILYATVALFQFVTLPVEFNASRRAIAVIDSTQMLRDDEIGGAKSVLRAAAMTYVAALAVSLANLLRLILRSNNRR